MKKFTIYIIVSILLVLGLSDLTDIYAAEENNTVIYFYSEGCLGCQGLEDDGYIDEIESRGITLLKINFDADFPSELPDNLIFDEADGIPTMSDLIDAYGTFYNIPESKRYTPLMIVGTTYYFEDEINEAVDNGEFFTNAKDQFLIVDVEAGQNYESTKGILGFLGVLGAGLLDGFNPCAIALLLMFISLVGFTENKKVLIVVSITYIFTMFITYFLIGIGVLSALRLTLQNYGLNTVVSWVIFIIVLTFFILNTYDYFVTKNEEYGKVKSQLPKWLQRMNKRIMKTFSNALNEEGSKGNMLSVILLTFFLGLTMSLTEFLCTGSIYLGILDGVKYFHEFYAYFSLFFYNIMFVVPMIVIAVIAIKSDSIMGVSNWIREHMHIIKLLNSVLFLILAIIFAIRLFG